MCTPHPNQCTIDAPHVSRVAWCGVYVRGAVHGVLKGYDQLVNLVLDEAVELLRGECVCVCGVP